ncbi:TetR/AcrR family transcriptional regulator [Nonomuraea soli]|uniref:AcrR family transcriptional regulator n=1 Tax=Nonomuraea soli TaxID=1032476 RepID=A0A7W0CFQ5_9ACTN|nr:TetR/AcrR family transcriptional regulator [Nonomuraea soli]MBA2890281.1 AcrR family transcriptional regulator [Nonomuraea soli]
MENSGVRRRPVQRRSIERVERILDACAGLLDEVGFDALTTAEVARRARVPAATVYQFFDGKPGMMRALALRNLDLLLVRLRRRAAAEHDLTWRRAAEIVLEETAGMRRTVPGFTVVDFADTRPGGASFLPAGQTQEGGDILAERLYAFAIDEAGLPPLRDPLRAMRLAIEAAGVALRLAFQHSRDGDPAMLAHGRTLLTAYLDRLERD